jgi:hypothetical protein
LHNDQAIAGLCDDRITPGIIPQDQAVPCIYYGTDRIKPIPVRDAQGAFSGTLEIGFQVEEGSYDTLEALTTAIRAVMDNHRGLSAGVSLTAATGTQTPDDFDDKLRLHTRALEYQVTGQIS